MNTSAKQILPSTIWLQWHGDGEPLDGDGVSTPDVTWCAEKIWPHDVGPFVKMETMPLEGVGEMLERDGDDAVVRVRLRGGADNLKGVKVGCSVIVFLPRKA